MDTTFYLPITTLAAVLNGLLLLAMTTSIALDRGKLHISLGDGGDPAFGKRQRGHANGVEQIPITLILLALAELQGAPDWLSWSAMILLTLGRYAHAIRFWTDAVPMVLRGIGAGMTMASQGVLLVWLTLNIVY